MRDDRWMRRAAVLWLAGWAFFGLPWRSLRSTPKLYPIHLNPFTHGISVDQLLNLLFYVPLGIIGVGLGWRTQTIVVIAALLSGGTELAQLFSTDRYPSVLDFILNTAGAVIGIALAGPAFRLGAIPKPTQRNSQTNDF